MRRYGTLCVLSSIAAAVYAFEYMRHRARASAGAKQWRFQSTFLVCTMIGLLAATLKCAFFLAFRWLQKAPEIRAAPKSSALLYSLMSDYYTM
jgi:NADH:ubiquinone oxidoreductase subunit 5 (subunit L)/multisubunit Na+/H+ antiporter MnhA subunit